MTEQRQTKGVARAIVLDPADNVAIAATALPAGESVTVAGHVIRLGEPIPVGHKFATTEIESGEDVRKYGEVIGVATRPIQLGSHVHTHNLVSARLP